MKKVLALVLAVVLCMGLGAVAFAATADSASNIPDVIAYVKVEKTPAGDGGTPAATYFKADDLKASIDWDDGKAQLDKIKLEDIKVGPVEADEGANAVWSTDEIDAVDNANGTAVLTIAGKPTTIAAANPAGTATGISAQLDDWLGEHASDSEFDGWTIAKDGTNKLKATSDNKVDNEAAPDAAFKNNDTVGKAAVAAADAFECIKVTVSFKEYYGTDEMEIGGGIRLKKGSVGKAMALVPAPAGEDAVTAGLALADSNKKLTFTNNFEWDELTAQTDKDDDTVIVDINTGAVIFNDDAAKFTTFEFANADALSVAGKMSKQDKVNMYLDTAVNDEIKALMKKNEDVDFDVLNFVGKPEFDFTQEVTWYLEDEDKEYFVYEVKDGKATKVNAKLNDDKDALVWKTRVLGAYIVTDAEIKAVTADEEKPAEDGDKENPETGASDFVGVAVALGAVSLVAAGAAALKK